MPTPPPLSDEQRRAAYGRSLELRRHRLRIKEYIALSGDYARANLKAVWDIEEAAQGMKVMDLLLAIPGVGPKTARRWLATAGIATKNTVRACGPKQTERLFGLLNR